MPAMRRGTSARSHGITGSKRAGRSSPRSSTPTRTPIGSGTRPSESKAEKAESPVKRHAGEAHALVAARVNVLFVVKDFAAAGADGLKERVGRRQPADTAAIALV